MKNVHKINVNVLILALLLTSIGVIKGQKSGAPPAPAQNVAARTPASVPEAVAVKPGAIQAPALSNLEQDLQHFISLEESSDRNPAQVAVEREKLLKNASLLRSLRGFLSRPALNAREASEQNAGFKLLLEAAHDEQSEVASETLRMVVADEEMDDIIKDGAGIHHSAAQNHDGDELAGLTPQALSGKLWQNAMPDSKPHREEAAAISH